ncbi:helix-turn-helix domain-containing protein [Nocardioides humilatus]|uniref:helix-turn-helix domain-containing protein n=1 Tax=Nocardioides humilatus TaxID=2607660 RepID=UPI001CB6BD04|nr:helix-turn-helix domain-containing protein [Nocardioides humilatus]
MSNFNGGKGERRLFTVDQAAGCLCLHRTTVHRLIAAGELQSIRVGRRRLIPEVAINRFIDDRLADAASVVPRTPSTPSAGANR